MVSGAMFDPLVVHLRDRFRILIPDLRGHGRSGYVGGPNDVASLASDLDTVLSEARFGRGLVLGYSHGGAVAQHLAWTRPAVVSRLILACTYACNVATMRERLECEIFAALLRLFEPGQIAKLIFRPSRPTPTGTIGLTTEQVDWLRSIMAANSSAPMRGVLAGLIAFDSRPWLREIRVPTVVVRGARDDAVPQHHFAALVGGIPGATGRTIERAGHALMWTHTGELADIVRSAAAS